MKIYLAGSVPKGAAEEKDFVNWRNHYAEALKKIFKDAEFIMPNLGDMDESDYLLIVGKDSQSIKISDLVVVNAEERLGAGTSLELAIAKYFAKPVISVIPKDSHHRRSNMTFQGKYFVKDWIHPFIHSFSDIIVEKVEDIEKVKQNLTTLFIKDISIIDKAIDYRSKK